MAIKKIKQANFVRELHEVLGYKTEQVKMKAANGNDYNATVVANFPAVSTGLVVPVENQDGSPATLATYTVNNSDVGIQVNIKAPIVPITEQIDFGTKLIFKNVSGGTVINERTKKISSWFKATDVVLDTRK